MEYAVFRVERTIPPASRPLLFLAGAVVQGTVRAGMVVRAGAAHRPSFREAIDAVECADAAGRAESWTVLGFRPRDPAELRQWREMQWEGATLAIPAAPVLHPCPCCGFRTRPDEEPGSYDICNTCGWEDDFVQYHEPDRRGGANAESLNEARAAFAAAHSPLRPGHDG